MFILSFTIIIIPSITLMLIVIFILIPLLLFILILILLILIMQVRRLRRLKIGYKRFWLLRGRRRASALGCQAALDGGSPELLHVRPGLERVDPLRWLAAVITRGRDVLGGACMAAAASQGAASGVAPACLD